MGTRISKGIRASASLKLTVPLILLGFAATLSTINLLYHVPQAERAAEADSRNRLAQEMSRLQRTLEYLSLRGDRAATQREISALANDDDVTFAALTDDTDEVVAATRRSWLGQPARDVLPQFDSGAAGEGSAGLRVAASGDLLGHASILLDGERGDPNPSVGNLFLAYDLKRYKAEARATVLRQSLYWAGWVTALALAMWLVFHFLLTRRTARLMLAAEQLAAGNLAARSGLRGGDELGRLGRAFDAMALQVADTQMRLRQELAERKRSAEELAHQRELSYQREKLAALGSLLAGVAHELNNPLSVVVARAVLLEEQGDTATRAAALKIRTAAERCARIVRTFLAMARQQRPERGPVAINDIVAAALDLAGYGIRTSSIDVVLDLSKAVPPILADADQLHQVLLNLIINAQQSLQERPAPRELRIHTCYDSLAEVVCITVADNGAGIPEHLRARVFEPYFTTKPLGVGTGVGLAVSLGIVEAHGGTITVACPPDGGAEITVSLPVRTVQPSAPEAGPVQIATASPCTILVVDDEAEIREALIEILADARHRVVAVASGHDALEQLTRERYDAILTDIRMPDLDGRSLYREIERRWPEQAAAVVFVTGDTLASTLREFVERSGRPVIEKPFSPNEVRRIVSELRDDGAAMSRR